MVCDSQNYSRPQVLFYHFLFIVNQKKVKNSLASILASRLARATEFFVKVKVRARNFYPMSTFGERLKILRGTQSQATFAKLFGIPQMTLSNYETGKSEPKFGLISNICTQFSVSSDWLLFGRGPMRPGTAAQCSDASPCPAPPLLGNAAEFTGSPCPRCPRLDARLEEMERERRELSTENRQLWRENATLREENATLRERQYQRKDNSPDSVDAGATGTGA